MHTRLLAANIAAIACLALSSTTSNAAGPVFFLEDAIPPDGSVIPLNAKLHTVGALMNDENAVSVQCDETNIDSVDCLGTPLSFSLVTTSGPYYFADMIFAAEIPRLEAGEPVLLDLVQGGSHLERRYVAGQSEDVQPPMPPSNISVASTVQYVGGTSGEFAPVLVYSWSASQDDTSIAYYRIENVVDGDFQLLSVRKHRGGNRHEVRVPIGLGEQVTAVVRAVDIAGNLSVPSASVSATGSSIVPPSPCGCSSTSDLPPSVFFVVASCICGIIVLRKRRRIPVVKLQGDALAATTRLS